MTSEYILEGKYFFKATERILTKSELEDASLLAETAKRINRYLNLLSKCVEIKSGKFIFLSPHYGSDSCYMLYIEPKNVENFLLVFNEFLEDGYSTELQERLRKMCIGELHWRMGMQNPKFRAIPELENVKKMVSIYFDGIWRYGKPIKHILI